MLKYIFQYTRLKVTLYYIVNDEILVGLKFSTFGVLCYINSNIFKILYKFAKHSSAKLIHWQIRQTLVLPIVFVVKGALYHY